MCPPVGPPSGNPLLFEWAFGARTVNGPKDAEFVCKGVGRWARARFFLHEGRRARPRYGYKVPSTRPASVCELRNRDKEGAGRRRCLWRLVNAGRPDRRC